MKKISFCIPCYGSEETIASVISEIHYVMLQKVESFIYEIVCVVDGSPDHVSDLLRKIAKTDTNLKVIILSRNFGQGNARMASLQFATGDYFVCLDDDGQCPLDKLWELLTPIMENYDVAIADYPKKIQSAMKNFGSYINKIMVHALLDVPPNFQMSNFYCFKHFVRDQILAYPNPYPYLTGLLAQCTNSFAQVPMEERPRASGKTGYTFFKLLRHWLDGFTSFSVKPLRVASFIGIICAMSGFIIGLEIIIRKLFIGGVQMGYSSVYASILFTGGIIMCLLGLIGEYIGRIYICVNRLPQYVVKEKINIENN